MKIKGTLREQVNYFQDLFDNLLNDTKFKNNKNTFLNNQTYDNYYTFIKYYRYRLNLILNKINLKNLKLTISFIDDNYLTYLSHTIKNNIYSLDINKSVIMFNNYLNKNTRYIVNPVERSFTNMANNKKTTDWYKYIDSNTKNVMVKYTGSTVNI